MFGGQTAVASAGKMRKNSPEVLTPPVQARIVYLKERNVYQGEEQGYSVTALVNKGDAETLGWFQNLLCSFMEVSAITEIPIHPFVNGMRPSEWNDGDDPKKATIQGYANAWFFKATTDFDSVKENLFTDVEMDGSPCTTGVLQPDGTYRRQASPDEIYPGCWIRMVICCAEYMRPGQCKFYLGGLVKVHKGEMWASTGQAKNLLGMSKANFMAAAAPVQEAVSTPAAAVTGGGFSQPVLQAPQLAAAPQFAAQPTFASPTQPPAPPPMQAPVGMAPAPQQPQTFASPGGFGQGVPAPQQAAFAPPPPPMANGAAKGSSLSTIFNRK